MRRARSQIIPKVVNTYVPAYALVKATLQTTLQLSSHVTSTSSSRRYQDDDESTFLAPSSRRRRQDISVPPPAKSASSVPPSADVGSPMPLHDGVDPLHEDTDALEGNLGGPSNLTMLIGYADHTALHV